MTRFRRNTESQVGKRTPWLRAAVLGANDGLLSTASLMVGVAAANSPRSAILIAGTRVLVTGSLALAIALAIGRITGIAV